MPQKFSFIASVIIVFVAIAITGCDEMNMVKPVVEDHQAEQPIEDQKPEEPTPPEEPMPPEELTPPEEPAPPEEPSAREKAVSVALETIELIQVSELRPQWEIFEAGKATQPRNEKTREILLEKTGLTWIQFLNLAAACLSETDNLKYVRGNNIRSFIAFTDLLVNYLELTYTHPEKTRGEILDLFTTRCSDGKVTALGRTVMRIYHPEQLEEYDAAWDLFFSIRNPDEDEGEGGDQASAE